MRDLVTIDENPSTGEVIPIWWIADVCGQRTFTPVPICEGWFQDYLSLPAGVVDAGTTGST